MISGLALSLREGLEAALILGIVFGTLRKLDRSALRRGVWLGAGAALLVSLAVGTTLTMMGMRLEGRTEEIFEGLTTLLAAGVLTWAIFWMRNQTIRRNEVLASGVESAVLRGGRWGLAGLAFLALAREGIELSLFLTASALASGLSATLIGALLGLLLAAGLGWGAYSRLIRLNLKSFFLVTGILLVLFAAGLVAHGIHELNEVGWIPSVIQPVWDIDPLLPESSFIGQLLTALLGYNSNPSLTEVLGYIAFVLFLTLSLRSTSHPDRRLVSRSSS